MRRPKLKPEQEAEVYRRVKAGARYADIQDWLASQGTRLAKSSISELRGRVERRALAHPPPELPDDYIDPRTGALVQVTDDMLMSNILREMIAEVYAPDASPARKRSATRLVLRTLTIRRKIRASPLPQRG